MLIYILIPCFNSAKYLNQCLASILMQEGDFELHVHIQDGKSTDSTLSIAKHWQTLVSEHQIPNTEKIKITIDSESDRGIYDAISKGFSKVPSSKDIVMTWLGSDDLLTNGSLATIDNIFRNYQEISWITGRSQTTDSNGCLFSPWKKINFSQNNIISGLYDGRTFGFIQQEGTFWRSELYNVMGGINKDLKYAGDFDLWRKFACIAKMYTLDLPLGIFRYRKGQTSSDKDSYYKEVESIKAHSTLSSLCQDLSLNSLDEYLYSYLIKRIPPTDNHEIIKLIDFNFIPVQSFSERMSPQIEQNIFNFYYWTLGKKSRLKVDVFELPILYKIILRIRNFHENQLLRIYNNDDNLLGQFTLSNDFNQTQIVTFKCNFNNGDTTLILELSQCLGYASEEGALGIIIEGLLLFPLEYMDMNK
jgi:glycosyltransferase involved in cell wall biosynthesis